MGSFIVENDRQPCEQAGWSCSLVAWLHSFPCMVCLPYIVVCGGDGDRSDALKHLTNSITYTPETITIQLELLILHPDHSRMCLFS